jgi:hygromycin-B 4-O-kinase
VSEATRARPDLVGVEEFLRSRFGDAVQDVVALTPGAWSSPFAFRLAGRDLVLRFSATDEDFRKDEFAARHRSSRLPIPAVVDIGTAFDGYFAITEQLGGDYLERVGGAQIEALLPSLFVALDEMREADISGTTGFGSWGADAQADHATWREALVAVGIDRPALRTHGWSERITSFPGPHAAFRDAYAAIKVLAEAQSDVRHLVHSDLLNRNVLVRGATITGVLDWGSSLYGDFLFDVAWLWFFAPWSSGWETVDFRNEAAKHYVAIGLDVPRFEERLGACALYIAIDALAYLAWQGWRRELDATAERAMDVLRG